MRKGLPKKGTPAHAAMLARRSQFDREIVEINPLPQRWWEYWLSCGHGCKMLVDPPPYRVGEKMSCFNCRAAARVYEQVKEKI